MSDYNVKKLRIKILLTTLLGVAIVYGLFNIDKLDKYIYKAIDYYLTIKNFDSDMESDNVNFPLRNFLPLVEDTYYVNYLKEKTLLITPRVEIDKVLVLSEVKDWVSKMSVDPETHKYVFVTYSR